MTGLWNYTLYSLADKLIPESHYLAIHQTGVDQTQHAQPYESK